MYQLLFFPSDAPIMSVCWLPWVSLPCTLEVSAEKSVKFQFLFWERVMKGADFLKTNGNDYGAFQSIFFGNKWKEKPTN